VTCSDLLVCYLSFAREAAGALGTRLSLRPLFPRDSVLASLGRDSRRGIADAYLDFHVIASEAKQSILSLRRAMDCFASLAMTASGGLKF
jgi:hypothetical protein